MDLTRINVAEVMVYIDTPDGRLEWQSFFSSLDDLKDFIQGIINELNEE